MKESIGFAPPGSLNTNNPLLFLITFISTYLTSFEDAASTGV